MDENVWLAWAHANRQINPLGLCIISGDRVVNLSKFMESPGIGENPQKSRATESPGDAKGPR